MRSSLIAMTLAVKGVMCSAQYITTEDIPRFWEAVDALAQARDHADSIACFHRRYLDRASEGLQRFMKVRDLSPEHYVNSLAKAPRFWKSIRSRTLSIAQREERIAEVLSTYEREVPGFKRPNVCFAIGHLSTGGTTQKDWILIGAEMVCADSTTDKSELNAWLKDALREEDQVIAYVAHEAVHTRQRSGPRTYWQYATKRLLVASYQEGVADFVAQHVASVTINAGVRSYGAAHEAELWNEFARVMHGNDISGWLYQGASSAERPADLGYFIGYRIAAAYFAKARDKRKALRVLLRNGAAEKVLRKGGYSGSCHVHADGS